jgi:hypothetical protein
MSPTSALPQFHPFLKGKRIALVGVTHSLIKLVLLAQLAVFEDPPTPEYI